MGSADRLHPSCLGKDPAYLAEINEPRHGYARDYRYSGPTPAASELMEECIHFALFWTGSRDERAAARVRQLNIQIMREYAPTLRGYDRERALRTISNLGAQLQ